MTNEPPLFVHNTHKVLYGNEPLCVLFRCDGAAFIGRELLELIVGVDFKELASIHMKILRERSDGTKAEIEYPFLRCDRTVFWAKTTSERLDSNKFIMTLRLTFEEWY